MKYTKTILVIIFISFTYIVNAQSFDYRKAWLQIEELSEKGLPKEASDKVDVIYKQATDDQESLQKVKCLIYKSNFRDSFEEEATTSTINEIKQELKKAEGIEKAMLLVALSDVYRQYYYQHQWEIRDRQEVAGLMSDNITEWSQINFTQQIDTLLKMALSYNEELKIISTREWQEIFSKNEYGFDYQPFLYDFVVWNAIGFYTSSEFSNESKEDLVLLNKPAYFQDYTSFINVETQENSSIFKAQILQLFQNLITFHQGRKDVRPLLYEEVKRLEFMDQKGEIEGKEELIRESLETLLKNNKNLQGVELIAKKLIEKYRYSKKEEDLLRADEICRLMIQSGKELKYFKSVSEQLHEKEISLNLKDAILPHQFSLAKVSFKNVNKLWYRIVKGDDDIENNKNTNEDLYKFLSKTAVHQFEILVAPKASLVSKSALFEIPPMDYGHYAIIASSGSEFDIDKDKISVYSFWVTNIEVVSQKNKGEFIIIDRQSGKAINGIEVKVFSNKWEYSSRTNVKTKLETLRSDKNGRFKLRNKNGQNRITLEISKGSDAWQTTTYVRENTPQAWTYEKHYFYTDRAIYRPGQTVYFKGIFTEKKGDRVKVLPNVSKEIFFYTSSGKQSIELTSNEFGSVSGSFVCPRSGLNSSLRIASDKGSVQFKMEEYKRPKFLVTLEMPTEEYALNKDIKIQGNASYFAGVSLQNAKVKFRVNRTQYMPWRWTSIPLSPVEISIAAGTTNTNNEGDFTIGFTAIAPIKIKGDAWYNYTVIAEITDKTGETHQQTLNIRLGTKSLFFEFDLLTTIDRRFVEDVAIAIKTANGKKLYRKIKYTLEKLKTTENVIQEIDLLADTILISEEDIAERFKYFSNSNQPKDLEVERPLLVKEFNTKNDSVFPKSFFRKLPDGIYKLSLVVLGKDKQKVETVKYFSMFSSDNGQMPYVTDYFFNLQNTSVKVGDSLHFSFGTSFKKQLFYYQISQGDKLIKSGWKTISEEMKHWKLPVLESYRGGVNLQIFFMRHNHFYSFDKQIRVPYDQKELDIQLMTSRNPMPTGMNEKWQLNIKNSGGHVVSAEVLAVMYDASLDVFAKHNWSLWPYQNNKRTNLSWKALQNNAFSMQNKMNITYGYIADYETLKYKWENQQRHGIYMTKNTAPGLMMDSGAENVQGAFPISEQKAQVAISEDDVVGRDDYELVSSRKNLSETAFFFPHLLTDEQGNVPLNFTTPEALSKWKLMVLATTKEMAVGGLEQEFITQKELMVMPNIPRFLRGGDKMTLSSKIINLLIETQEVSANLEIFDAKDMTPLHLLAEGSMAKKTLTISAKSQETVMWEIEVPEQVGAVIIRMTATGGKHTDGEEHLLPVLSQLQFLTDTYPFSISRGTDITAKSLSINSTDNHDDDELTVEITTHPLWYVVQALPNFTTPKQASAISWFQYYYMNALAQSVLDSNPQIETIFNQWLENDPEELQSELLQNQDLKQILLEETPWVKNAENQSRRKQEIALLFNKNNISHHMENALHRLNALQTSNGGWAWYKDMKTSVTMTAEIVEGIGELKNAGIVDFTMYSKAKGMIQNAVKYIDEELLRIYQKDKGKNYYYVSDILSARAYFLDEFKLNVKTQEAFDYYLKESQDSWQKKGLEQQAELANMLLLSDKKEQAQVILLSLKDKSLEDDNGGIYWRDLMRYNAPDNQASMIELFELADADKEFINGLKIWLLQQKRSNDWGSGKSTAKACYAMLSGAGSLDDSTKVFLTVDGETTEIGGNAGLGYYKVSWKGAAIQEKLDGLKISKVGDGLVFGAVYKQYFAKINEVESQDGGVEISKEIYVETIIKGKAKLKALSDVGEIALGDRILVRLIIENKQAMDYVHLRDYLPAGFENIETQSVYKWNRNMIYYQSPNDISTNFFINHLPKGKFVIEYELNATISGDLNLGPAKIQSLYAPEFSGRTSGGVVIVR